MRKIKMLLLISLLSLYLFTGCEKQKPVIDLESIDISEIEKIELFGTTGGRTVIFPVTCQRMNGRILLNCGISLSCLTV